MWLVNLELAPVAGSRTEVANVVEIVNGVGMIDRFHLDLGLVALVVGLIVVILSLLFPNVVGSRRLVIAGVASPAVILGWGAVSGKAPWVWLVVASLVFFAREIATARLPVVTPTADPAAAATTAAADAATATAVAASADSESGQSRPDGTLRRWTPVMAMASLIGIWAAVPDTEPALVAGAVLLPVALIAVVRTGAAARSSDAPRFRDAARPRDADLSSATARLQDTASSRDVCSSALPVFQWAEHIAVIVTIVGAAWVGSAGWWSARASVVAIGVLLWVPVIESARSIPQHRSATLVAVHMVVALVLPRSVMGMSPAWAWAVVAAASVLIGLVVSNLLRKAPSSKRN